MAAVKQRHGRAERLPRHRHRHGYAAIVLSGGYIEAGDRGRFRAEAGHVLFHKAFEAHWDLFGSGGAEILNIPLDIEHESAAGRCSDPDSIVKLAESDLHLAGVALLRDCVPSESPDDDWPDLLARDLGGCDRFRLDEWADTRGLHPASVSRGFRLAYGVSPKRFRLERMAARAARKICATGAPLSRIAADTGFADQAHMTRALVGLFGLTPMRLRRSS